MTVTIHIGDCREVLPTMGAASISACITDPPYEFAFMGKKWDNTGVAFDVATWREVLRALKPGAHLLAFGGTRTHHRMMCAIEDAGFEIRDCLGWLYGSGFPKSKNLDGEWTGWGTALKPAWEPIILARKPLIGTVADNAMAHCTGAMNIDGCRITTGDERLQGSTVRNDMRGGKFAAGHRPNPGDIPAFEQNSAGRWPANILHDGSDEVLAIFPDAPGQLADISTTAPSQKTSGIYGAMKREGEPSQNDANEGAVGFNMKPGARRLDTGSAARFFYCAKVGRAERDVGLQGFEKKAMNWSSGEKSPGTFQSENTDRSARNHHPTVKPVELMRYLIRLITPPGGTVLDCFAGSGSTLRAADIEGFDAIGIEQNPEYAEIAKHRINGDAPLFQAVA